MRIIALCLASLLVLPVFGCIFDSSGELIIESSERQNPFSGGKNATSGFSLTIKNYADSAKHPELNITVPSFIQLFLESPGIATEAESVEEITFEEVEYDGTDRVYTLKPIDSDYKVGSGEKFTVYFTVWADSGRNQDTGSVELYGDGELTHPSEFDWKVDII